MTWIVYLVRCRDGSLYTGITTDPERRLREHNRGVGAAYTRSRLPVSLVPARPAPAGSSDRELGESRWAPSSTPTPRRSTNSPPSQPVTRAMTAPVRPETMAPVGGASGA